MFSLVPNPIVFKRNGAQFLLHQVFQEQDHTLFQLFFMGKEERQNSNYGVEFSQKCQKSGRPLVKSRQGSMRSIVFCGKVEAPTFFWASYFSQKCHRRGTCQRRTEMLPTYCYLWEMRGTKSLEFLVAIFQFLWIFQRTDAHLIQARSFRCFFTKMQSAIFVFKTDSIFLGFYFILFQPTLLQDSNPFSHYRGFGSLANKKNFQPWGKRYRDTTTSTHWLYSWRGFQQNRRSKWTTF